MRALAWIIAGTLAATALGCGTDDAWPAPTVAGETELDLYEGVAPSAAPTYENVALLFRGDPADDLDGGACAFSGCHSGNAGKAGITFRKSPRDDALVYTQLVEGVLASGSVGPRMSCEYNILKRVEPGDPSRSWLYIKLAAHAAADGVKANLVPAPEFDQATTGCKDGFHPGYTFPGSLMPYSEGEPVYRLAPAELRMVAEWILDGAPGPTTP